MTEAERIIQLENENSILKAQNQKKVIKIDKYKTFIPLDYEQLKKNNRLLQQRCKNYENLLSAGNISSLDTLIDSFINSSKTKLKKIVTEIKLNEFSQSTNKQVEYFISYLDFIRNELNSFINISELGKSNDPYYLKCKKQLQITNDIIIKNDDINEQELITLYDFLKIFQSKAKKKAG